MAMPGISQFAPDDEGDVCRVCRSEADENNPLIYPCKCSGSVRFVHPDCLKNWLAHSQKKHCEICGYHYKFTKVYPSSLPSVIPRIVFVRQSFFAVNYGILRILRVIVVAWAWLVALPSFNMFSLRLLLLCADWVSYPYLKHSLEALHPDDEAAVNATISAALDNASSSNSTIEQSSSNSSMFEIVPAIAKAILRPVLVTLTPFSWLYNFVLSLEKPQSMNTILRGQILSLTLAAVLVGIILLREWMHQHDWNRPPAPPEEEEINPDDWEIMLGVAYPRGTGPSRRKLISSPGPSPLTTDFPTFTVLPEPIERDGGEGEKVVYLGGKNGEVERNRGGPSMRVQMPQFDQNNPLHRPSPQTPNLDVAYSAPEMLAESSKGKEREILFDTAEILGDESSEKSQGAGASTEDRPDPISQSPDYSSSPFLSQRRRSLRTPELTQEELDQQIVIGPSDVPDNLSSPSISSAPNEAEQVTEGSWSTGTLVTNIYGAPAAAHSLDHISSDESTIRVSNPAFNELRQRYKVSVPEDSNTDESFRNFNSSETLAVPTTETTQPSSISSSTVNLVRPTTSTTVDPSMRGVELEMLDSSDPLIAQYLVTLDNGDSGGRDLGDGSQADSPRTPSAAEWELVEEDEEDHLPEMDGEDDDQIVEMVEEDGPVGEGEEALPNGDPNDEEFRVWEAEDWDGVLEVIGLIGPLSSMFQNVFFAMIVMAGSLSLLIGAPAIIGKMMLAADFIRLSITFISYLLRCIRFFVDPATDIIFEITANIISNSPFLRTIHAGTEMVLSSLGDVLESIGGLSFNVYREYRLWAVEMASSGRTGDQVACVTIGYVSLGLIIAAFALAGETGILQLSSTVVQTAKQYGTFIKLAFFMGLELICFPLAVGIFIGSSTLPLLPDWTLNSYIQLFKARPFGLAFVAWIVGTIFMFAFASGIAFIRSISRKGTLFFIRDPADDSFSPVKEILERTTFWQLRKLFGSIVTYGLLIFFIFGVTSWTVSKVPFLGILPLRLNYGPLSSVPFDVLFVHLIIPPSWRLLKPKHKIKKRFLRCYRYIVRTIGLRSLVLGEYQPTNTDSPTIEFFWSLADKISQLLLGKYDSSLTFARVPSKDTVALLSIQERRKAGIFVRLDEYGVPRTEEDKIRLLKQDRAARAVGRDPKKDYEVVRLPRFWRTRAYALVFALVGLTSSSLVFMFFTPLLVGRLAVTLFTDKYVYDGYSLMLGFYVIWGSYSLGRFVQRRVTVANKARRIRQSNLSMRIKRTILGSLRCAYSAVLMYVITPLIVGVNFEVYASIPMRYGLDGSVAPVLHVWDAWAMGLVLMSLYFGIIGSMTNRGGRLTSDRAIRLKEAFRKPFAQRFVDINILVFPVLSYMLVPIVLPWLLSVAIVGSLNMFGVSPMAVANAISFRMMFPLTSTSMILILSRQTISKYLSKVRQRMIDSEYVLEERVENFESTPDDGDPDWEDM